MVKIFPTRLLRKAMGYLRKALLLGLCSCCSLTQAAMTREQAVQYITRVSMPAWRKAVDDIQNLRRNPLNRRMMETWVSLDTQTDLRTGQAPLARATSPRNANDMFLISGWLRWRILATNADGRYAYAYAANLHAMRDAKNKPYLKEAAVFFFHARLALTIDGARCADQRSAFDVMQRYEAQPRLQALMEDINQMSKKDAAWALLEAVALEGVRGERLPLPGLCTLGELQTNGTVGAPGKHLKPESPFHTNSVLPTAQPQLIDEKEWSAKRVEIMNQRTNTAMQSL